MGFIFVLFLTLIILNLDLNSNFQNQEYQNILTEIKNSVNQVCIDPFSETQFSFQTKQDFLLQTFENTICLQKNELIFCERVQCQIQELNLTSEIFIKDRIFNCIVSRGNQNITIICQ